MEGNAVRDDDEIIARFSGAKRAKPEALVLRKPIAMTVTELLAANVADIKSPCAPFVTEGLTTLAAAPKTGKTTLARQGLEANGLGGAFLGGEFDGPARGTFISLEEGERLFRKKVEMMGMDPRAAPMVDLFFEWPQGALGCAALVEHLEGSPDTRLVVIDTLSRFRATADKSTTQFQADYDAVTGLSSVAKQFPGVAIWLVHHTRKARSADAMDDISGTYGLTAATDAYLVLRKEGKGATLHAGGRLWELEDNEFQLSRKDQRWHMDGVSDGLTSGERFVLRALTESGGMTPNQLGKVLDCSRQNAYERLKPLVAKGKAHNEDGFYVAT